MKKKKMRRKKKEYKKQFRILSSIGKSDKKFSFSPFASDLHRMLLTQIESHLISNSVE
jgi:hypothetical protein